MKKLLLTLVALLPFVGASASDVSFVALKGDTWRYGLSFDSTLKAGPVSFRIPVVVDESYDRLFLGVSASYPLFDFGGVALRVEGGWTANFNDLTKPRDGQWALGAGVSFRF